MKNKLLVGGAVLVVIALVATAYNGLNGSLLQGNLKIPAFSNSSSSNSAIQKPAVALIQSNYFRNDIDLSKVLGGQAVDFSNSALYSKTDAEYVNTVPYKVFLALYMVGYQTDPKPYKSADFMIPLLERFQTSNGLPVSSLLDKNDLVLLDAQLAKEEKQIAGYSNKMGTIFNSMTDTSNPGHIPKDFIGWILIHPLEMLPDYLNINLTPANYFVCTLGSCIGSLKKADGTNYPGSSIDYYKQGNFTFWPDVFHYNSILKSSGNVGVVIHEYAHWLDGSVSNYSDQTIGQGIIDTSEFNDISYDMNAPFEYGSCRKRRSNNVKDYITHYGFDGANSQPCKNYGPEYGAPHEEFAEAFATYVMAGNAFRAAAQSNAVIKAKYLWLKDNVFLGSEYFTDLSFGNSYMYSGCANADDTDTAGGPFYVSCNSNFFWDGGLPHSQTVRQFTMPKIKLGPLSLKTIPGPIPEQFNSQSEFSY